MGSVEISDKYNTTKNQPPRVRRAADAACRFYICNDFMVRIKQAHIAWGPCKIR